MNSTTSTGNPMKHTHPLFVARCSGVLALVALWASAAGAQPPLESPPPTATDATSSDVVSPADPSADATAEQPEAPLQTQPGEPAEPSETQADVTTGTASEASPQNEQLDAKKPSGAASEAVEPPPTLALDEAREPAKPPNTRFSLLLHGDVVWHQARSLDFFSEDGTGTRLGLSFSMDLIELGQNATLDLGVGYSLENLSSGSALGSFATSAKLSAQHLALTPSLRYKLLPWLSPQLRAFGGASFVETTVDYALRGQQKDDTVTPHFGAAAGFMASFTPAGGGALSRTLLGVVVEGGYVVGSAIQVKLNDEPASSKASEGRRIEANGAELGEVERSGPFLRIAGALRF